LARGSRRWPAPGRPCGHPDEPAEGGLLRRAAPAHGLESLDAYIGGARLTPSDAYRFAKGEEVVVGGQKVRLHAPLDWAAVMRHAAPAVVALVMTASAGPPGAAPVRRREAAVIDS